MDLISDHSLHIQRSAFATANTEKTARATLSSAVKRSLGRDTVTIVDSGNYIKGFRYQMHCEAKALGVRNCVVHVGVTGEKSKEVNDERLRRAASSQEGEEGTVGGAGEQDPYDAKVHEELVMRFEEPNALARWDSPCFVIPWDDEAPPCLQIWEQVVLGLSTKTADTGEREKLPDVRPNAATVLPSAPKEGSLHELDRLTNAVVQRVLGYVKEHSEVEEVGGEVKIEGETLVLPAMKLGTPQLQRLRRQFIQLKRSQMGSQGYGAFGERGGDSVGRMFVGWLGDALERGG